MRRVKACQWACGRPATLLVWRRIPCTDPTGLMLCWGHECDECWPTHRHELDNVARYNTTLDGIPDDLKEEMDFLNGSDRGRIYRVRTTGDAKTAGVVDIRGRSAPDLVAACS